MTEAQAIAALTSWSLAFARVAPLVWITPFLGGRAVPAPARAALAIVLASCAAPRVTVSFDPSLVGLAVLLAREVALGAALGFGAAVVFHAATAAGAALDQTRGAPLADAMAPVLGDRSTPLGQLCFQLVVLVFCQLGGPALVMASVQASFEVFPPGPSAWPSFASSVQRVGEALRVALGLVLPGLFAALLVDFVFGVSNRMAPALNAYFLALGAKSLVVIAILAATMLALVGGTPQLVAPVLRDAHAWTRGESGVGLE